MGFNSKTARVIFKSERVAVAYRMRKDESWQDLAQYYDERALEYDAVYSGKGPSFPNQRPYIEDVEHIQGLVSQFGHERIIDIACGTGFWLPYYASNCTEITMLDQSVKMLEQAKKRAREEGIFEKCKFIRGDFFELELDQTCFQSAIIGFLLSHLTDSAIRNLLTKLNSILVQDAQLLIIDSAWSKERQIYREKEGMQKRKLDDGRVFSIYKRYFDIGELDHVLEPYGFHQKESYFGDAFLALVLETK